MTEEQFFKHTRMTRPLFNLLLTLVGDALRKPRQRIGVEERLSLTLLHLAHGEPIQTIAWSYKLGRTTVRNIILETCEVLWRVLSPIYVAEPTEAQYKDIVRDFETLWNMPNCVGAIDGKHVAIQCPANSGSMFYNYKKFFSIVLMAACDAKYTFTAVSIGSFGSQSDSGIFQASEFGRCLINNTLPLPPDKPLCSDMEPFPHFFVGDSAFPLKRNIMRPYGGRNLNRSQRIFNYRLSRARRVIENAFGILTSRWRVIRTMDYCPENCESIVLGCIALHNFIMLNDHDRWYCGSNYVDREGAHDEIHPGEWRREVSLSGTLRNITTFSRRASDEAFQLRDKLANFFINEGSVPFQDERINH